MDELRDMWQRRLEQMEAINTNDPWLNGQRVFFRNLLQEYDAAQEAARLADFDRLQAENDKGRAALLTDIERELLRNGACVIMKDGSPSYALIKGTLPKELTS